MSERIISNGQGSETDGAPAEAPVPGAAAEAEGAASGAPCEDCLSGRALVFVAMFAAFAAYVAADFASGGRLTAGLLALVGARKGDGGG